MEVTAPQVPFPAPERCLLQAHKVRSRVETAAAVTFQVAIQETDAGNVLFEAYCHSGSIKQRLPVSTHVIALHGNLSFTGRALRPRLPSVAQIYEETKEAGNEEAEEGILKTGSGGRNAGRATGWG